LKALLGFYCCWSLKDFLKDSIFEDAYILGFLAQPVKKSTPARQ
jgi:hypothetical protein